MPAAAHAREATDDGYAALDDQGVRIYRDRDGWDYGAFWRGYVDAEGFAHRYVPVRQMRSFTAERPFAGLRRVLESLGFTDVRLAEGKPLGTRRNVVVVAVRP